MGVLGIWGPLGTPQKKLRKLPKTLFFLCTIFFFFTEYKLELHIWKVALRNFKKMWKNAKNEGSYQWQIPGLKIERQHQKYYKIKEITQKIAKN